jgi:ribosomal protein S18 acetylase RimI-like enzyme
MSVAVRIFPEQEEGTVFQVLKRVSESYETVRENHHKFSELHDAIMQMEKFIFSTSQDGTKAETILDGISPEMLARTNDAYHFWQTGLEDEFAHRVVKDGLALQDYLLYERFSALVKRELALISRSGFQRILFLGSGAVPISALLLHAETGVPVDCVARDSSAIEISRKVVESFGVGGAVTVLGDKDSDYDTQNYDLIVIGILFRSKKNVLKTVRKRSQPGCQVLCRTSCGTWQLIYESISDRERRGFYLKAQQLAEGQQGISTWLLEAAGSAAADIRLEWLHNVDSDTGRQLLRLMNRTLEEETTIGFPGPIDDQTGSLLMQQLNKDVESSHRHVLVAYKDGVIVGQLILTPNSSPNHQHIVELTRGTIDPSFRGGGLALRAFEEIASKCEELNREVICLDVRAGTHAALWWQHFGFKQYGLLVDYSRAAGKRYQGLYLTQTTEELKERLRELLGVKTKVSAGADVAAVK